MVAVIFIGSLHDSRKVHGGGKRLLGEKLAEALGLEAAKRPITLVRDTLWHLDWTSRQAYLKHVSLGSLATSQAQQTSSALCQKQIWHGEIVAHPDMLQK